MTGLLHRLLALLRARPDNIAGTGHAGGKLFVVSAPSGAGKTSLVKALLGRSGNLQVSVSHTTRQQRPSEEHGRDYFFVDKAQFEQIRKKGGFLESAQVFDNFYGTSAKAVADLLAAGHNVMLEIDWQGAQQIRCAQPDAITIFILPPSRSELERRLRGRSTDSEAVIRRRLSDSVSDMRHWNEFDYVVVNDNFEQAVDELLQIVAGQGQASAPDRPSLARLVANLLE